jgi:hypothetical protein
MKIDKIKVIDAIRSEPELPDEMPDEMWDAIKNDRDACTAAFRICAQETKKNIIERINKL